MCWPDLSGQGGLLLLAAPPASSGDPPEIVPCTAVRRSVECARTRRNVTSSVIETYLVLWEKAGPYTMFRVLPQCSLQCIVQISLELQNCSGLCRTVKGLCRALQGCTDTRFVSNSMGGG